MEGKQDPLYDIEKILEYTKPTELNNPEKKVSELLICGDEVKDNNYGEALRERGFITDRTTQEDCILVKKPPGKGL